MYKKYTQDEPWIFNPWIKLCVMIKLSTLFLLLGFLTVHAEGLAQEVTLMHKNISLKDAFMEIKKQTGYNFLWAANSVKSNRTVSANIKRVPLKEAVNLLLQDLALDYKLEDQTILITEDATRLPFGIPENVIDNFLTSIEVRGRVIDGQGNPLIGASVKVKGTTRTVLSNEQGEFVMDNMTNDAVLEISYVGYESREIKAKSNLGDIRLVVALGEVDEVEVVINTGYQQLKPNEMAGAAEVITKKMLMEQTGTTILERLEGMSGSLNFNNKVMPGNNGENPNSVLNMTIRGYSTINGTTDPLIILNNFPYTGEIDNIDPNDVESIVILKDAAATAMWGIRAANGVIVITTSGAKFGQKTRVSYRSTVTHRPKPDLNKVDVADGPEVYDFIAELLGKSLPAVLRKEQDITELEYAGWQYYKGHISEQEFNEKLDRLKAIRPREQWLDLLYRNGLAQTHSLNISGGSDNLSWTVSANREDQSSVLQAKFNRNNIRMTTAFKMNEKLRLEMGITYTKSFSKTGAPAYNSIKQGLSYQSTLGLVNPDGTAYGWYPFTNTSTFNPIHMDTVANGFFRDVQFYPLTDWKHHYTTNDLEGYIKNARIVYTPIEGLDVALNVQAINQRSLNNNRADQESYYSRYNVALYSNIDEERGLITRQVPEGGIHQIRESYANSFNSRLDVNYRKILGKGSLIFNGAFDISESIHKSDGKFLVGYIETPRSFQYPNQQAMHSTLSGGLVNINLPVQGTLLPKEITQRNISTTASLSYIYDDRYIVNFNARRDGANILGVNVNDRWKPNYSIAGNWRAHKESFFDIPWISNLTTGVSFGYVGNVDVSKSSRIIARSMGYHALHTQLPGYWQTEIPPNPELRWEKTAHTNVKLDLGLFNDRLQVLSNYFVKNISDLYQNTTVDPIQTLPGNYVANAGEMQIKGYELNVMAKVIKNPFAYDITFSTANMKEKIKYYPNGKTQAANMRGVLANDGVALGNLPSLLVDMPLYAVFSIAGDHSYVNEMGEYIIEYDGQSFNNGTTLLNYIIASDKQDFKGVHIHGSATPSFTAGMHHRFQYKNWFLLVSLQAEIGHYFKYPVDRIGTLSLSSEFENRWKSPGDEEFTNVPKFTLPQDPSFNNYANYSGHNIYKGDVIRLNNVQLSYTVPTKKLRMLNLAINAQNLGAIWTANKKGYDYRYLNYMTWGGTDKYYSFTLNVGI